MAEIRYAVTVDSSGAVTSIKKLDDAWRQHEQEVKKAGGAADKTGGQMRSLWKDMAIGQLAMQAINATYRTLVDGIGQVIGAAAAQEKADNALRAALIATGRSVEGNLEHYKDMATELQRTTVYSDDAVQGAQALMLSLVNLDQEGMDAATKGAAGLATVFGMDLQLAATVVGKALAGNYGALSRYGIKVDESLSQGEKQAALLQKLSGFYQQSQKETGTFTGSLAQLKNAWNDVQEEVGNAIVKNQDVRDTIAELTGKIQELIKSDDFKLWVSAAAEMISKLAKGISAVVKGVGSLMDKLAGAKGYREFIDQEQAAHGAIQEGISIIRLRRQAIDEDVLSVKEWGQTFEKYGRSNQALMKAIVEGKEGPELLALYRGLKDEADEAAAAAKAAAEKTKPAINETGDAAALAAERVQKLKSELKLTFADDVKAQIERLEDALAEFQNELTPAGAEELRKKIAELKAQFPPAFTEINVAIGEASDATLTMAEHLYGVGLAAIFTAKETDPLAKEFKKIAEAAKKAEGGMDRMTKAEIRTKIRALQKELREMGDSLPVDEVVRLKQEIADLQRQLAMPDWLAAWKLNLDQFSTYAKAAIDGLSAIVSQAQRNKEIEIENEYKKRLELINATYTNEEERQRAITALEAEFEIKRTSAKRSAARSQKAVALMGAVVNTAEAVTEALPNLILAAIVGAMGAVQIALIARQPIPLAKGAVFEGATQFLTQSGQLYEAGEAGREILGSEKAIREILRDELERAPKRRGGGPVLLAIHLDGRKLAEALLPDLESLSVRGRLTTDIQGLVRSEQ